MKRSTVARVLFDITDEEASFARRGFRVEDAAARAHLEKVGCAFLGGYRTALRVRDGDLVAALDLTPAPTRGFAYEGAAMALTLLDTLFPWRARLRRLLAAEGSRHGYMLHVGAGWALARLHRRPARWTGGEPMLGWLAVDGYGFHQGYFHPDRFVRRTARPRWAWGYASRAFDQGLGRSVWFVCGADARASAEAIDRFPGARQPDLWSGLGLAAAYAGGASRVTLEDLRNRAGSFLPWLAQGVAFAATARADAENLTPETALACRLVCACEAEEAAALARRTRPDTKLGWSGERYESWRSAIREAFAGGPAQPELAMPSREERVVQ